MLRGGLHMPRLKTSSEVATMEYLRELTKILVPHVFHWDMNLHNRLDGEFMLLQKVSLSLDFVIIVSFSLLGLRDPSPRSITVYHKLNSWGFSETLRRWLSLCSCTDLKPLDRCILVLILISQGPLLRIRSRAKHCQRVILIVPRYVFSIVLTAMYFPIFFFFADWVSSQSHP